MVNTDIHYLIIGDVEDLKPAVAIIEQRKDMMEGYDDYIKAQEASSTKS